MTINIPSDQMQNILQAVKSALTNPTLKVNGLAPWANVYDLIYQALTNVVSSSVDDFGAVHTIRAPLPGVDPMTLVWLQGARDTNNGSGAFSDYIRGQTDLQYYLRTGTHLSPSEIQTASDDISQNVAYQFLTGLTPDAPDPNGHPRIQWNQVFDGTIPLNATPLTIDQIGDYDATSVAGELYKTASSSSGNANFTPWSGTTLFVDLGVTKYFENWIAQDKSGSYLNGFKAESGTYDLVAAAEVAVQMKTGWSAAKGLFTGQYFTLLGLEFQNSQAIASAESTADAFFKAEYGSDVPFGSIGSAIFDGLTGLISANDTYQVGTIYGSTSNNPINLLSDTRILNAGPGNDTINAVAFQSLDAAQVAVIDGGGGTNALSFAASDVPLTVSLQNGGNWNFRFKLDAGEAYVTDYAYEIQKLILSGHGDTVIWGKDFSANGIAPTSVEINEPSHDANAGKLNTVDLTGLTVDTNVRLAYSTSSSEVVCSIDGTALTFINFDKFVSINGAVSLDANGVATISKGGTSTTFDTGKNGIVLIGSGSANDTLNGNGGADVILGGDGDDVLCGDAGVGSSDDNIGSYLAGGAGDDTYYAHNYDTVDDSDGKGTVYFGEDKLSTIVSMCMGDFILVDDRTKYLVTMDGNDLIVWNTYSDGKYTTDEAYIRIKNWIDGTLGISSGSLFGTSKPPQGPIPPKPNPKGGVYTSSDSGGSGGTGGSGDSGTGSSGGTGPGNGNTGSGPSTSSTPTPLIPAGANRPSSGGPRVLPPGTPDVSPLPMDPLVLDLAGNGIKLTALKGSQAYFDFSGSGIAHQTGWIQQGDGLLYLDDGTGSTTVKASELLGALSGNGFADLAALDANHDGVIDANDPAFAKLRVWVAGAGTGQSQAGELFTLSQLGITSIGVNSGSSSPNNASSNYELNGNALIGSASFIINGASHTIAEVNFQTSMTLTQYAPPADFTYSIDALKLPFLESYGLLPNLQMAMTQNADLLSAVKSLVNSAGNLSYSDFDSAFQNVLRIWAKASNIDPASKGTYVDARDLAVTYAFYGIDPTSQTLYANSPNWHNGPLWEQAYRAIVNALEVRFLTQVGASQLLDGATWSSVQGSSMAAFMHLQYDVSTDQLSGSLHDFIAALGVNAPSDQTSANTYWLQLMPMIKLLENDLFASDSNAMGVAFIAAAEATGLPHSFETTFLSNIGTLTLVDEGSSTGILNGVHTNSILLLGSGDKSIVGATPLAYIYSSTGGNDVIDDGHSSSKLVFADIASTGVTISRSGASDDLVMTVIATSKTVTIKGQFVGWPQEGALQSFTFSDGVTWSQDDIKHKLLAQAAAQPTGQVYGFSGNDTITAGLGDKYLSGQGGADTYVYSSAGGNDVIDDAHSSSKLVLTDIAATGITISRDGPSSDLVLTVVATGKTVTIRSQFVDWPREGALQSFTFSDGVTWSQDDIKQKLIAQAAALPTGQVYGFSGNDTILAGVGDKYLSGQGGADTYVYSSTGGNDVIDDGHSSSKLVFSDIVSTDVTISRDGASSDLVLTVVATGKTVTIKGQFVDWPREGALQSFTFSDGVTWSQDDIKHKLLAQAAALPTGQVYGFSGNDTILAGVGDKYLSGQGGTDTYVYSSTGGNDVIDDGHSSSKLVFSDIASTDVAISRDGASSDLVITATATGKTVTIRSQFVDWPREGALQSFTFSDGVIWSQDDIKHKLLAQAAAQPTGQIYGFSGNDTILAGVGDKYLSGQGGADTYVYSSSGGNDIINDGHSSSKLVFADIASTGVTISRNGSSDDLVMTVTATGKTVTIRGQFIGWPSEGALQSFTFSDNVIWSRDDISRILTEQSAAGRAGAITTMASSGETLDVDASNGGIYATANSSTVHVAGTANWVTLYGGGSTASVSGASNWVHLVGTAETTVLSGDNEVVVAAAGSKINVNSGTGDVITASRSTITLSDGVTAEVDGSGNIIALGSGSNAVIASGVGTTIQAGNASNNAIRIGDNVSVTVSGSGVNVSGGTGDTVTVGGNGVDGASNVIQVSHGTINLMDNTRVDLTGSNDVVHLGNGYNIGIGGNNQTVYAGQNGTIWDYSQTGTTYVYGDHFGTQGLANFSSSNGSVISFASSEFADFAAVLNNGADTGANVAISGQNGDILTIGGVHKADLVASEFAFRAA